MAARLVMALLCFAIAGRAGSAPLEAQVRAAYLINFTRYVAWPGAAPHLACLVGADEIAEALLANQSKSGLAVRRIADPRELTGCTVLYLGRDSTQTSLWLRGAQDKPILTVGELGGFLGKGGIINLVTLNNALRFEVHLGNAARANLKLSSRMLALAERVEGGAP